jgi:lipoate-protein ligase B
VAVETGSKRGDAEEREERPGGQWVWLGRVPFAPTAALQEELRDKIHRREEAETLLLCEHDPVITRGRRAHADHVLASEQELAARGIELVTASRGGDVTYHGPGQLVGYPIFRLRRGLLFHMEAMAAAIQDVLRLHGLEAEWRRSTPGLWIGGNKICAFGVHVRHRIATHGFALNVAPDLGAFDTIVPCGLRDAGVTSILKETGASPRLPALGAALAVVLSRHFQLPLRRTRGGESAPSSLQKRKHGR